jgi:pyruvate kinase
MARAGRTVPVIAKLEKQEAVERLEEILDAFDGVMVARGDLGVETPLEGVPWVQKRAIRLARARAKPVIVATEMLESMITRPRPTRAEASDVANAALDGADALMLSGETSVGKFPVETVATMQRLILAAEEEGGALPEVAAAAAASVSPAGGSRAVDTARALHARVLAAFTRTGATARQIAAHRPAVATLAFTSDDAVLRQLALVWGVEAVRVPDAANTEEMIVQVDRAVRALGAAEVGELVVIVAGAPIGVPGSTNLLHVHRVGDAVGAGAPPRQG